MQRSLLVLTLITWGTHRPQPQGTVLARGSLGNPLAVALWGPACLRRASPPGRAGAWLAQYPVLLGMPLEQGSFL